MKHGLLLLFLILPALPSFGSEPVIIRDSTRSYDLFAASELLVVPAGKVSIDDLLQRPGSYRFTPTRHDLIRPYDRQFGYWFRFSVTNQTAGSLFLHLVYAGTERIDMYEFESGRRVSEHRLGTLRAERTFTSRKSTQYSPMTTRRGQTSVFYVYMEGVYTTSLMLFGRSLPNLLEVQHRHDLFYGLYYGFILIVIIYSLVMYVRLRVQSYVRYAIWVLFVGLQLALFRGHLNEFLWAHNPAIERYGTGLAGVTGLLHILFTLSFLKLRLIAPLYYRIGIGVFVLYSLGLFVNLVSVAVGSPTGQQLDFVPQIALLEGVYSLVAGVVAWRRNFRPALYYILGNLAFFASIFVFLTYAAGRLPHRFWTYESIHLGSGIEITLFMLALAYKVNLLKKEREQAIQERIQALQENERLVSQQNLMLEQQVGLRTAELRKEQQRSEELLLNILPDEIIHELKQNGASRPRRFEQVTVLFTDIQNFTKVGERLSPEALVSEIDYYFRAFDGILSRYAIEKIKTIGDAYLCAGGLPVATTDNAQEVVRAALEMRDFMLRSQQERQATGQPGFGFRIGIHTGPVVAGIVGVRKFAYDIWGDTVNTAARMEQHGEVGKVNISEVTYQLVKDQFRCHHRGKVTVKNKGELDMYFAEEPVTV